MTGIVLNARTYTEFSQGFQVIAASVFQTFPFQRLVIVFKVLQTLSQFNFNVIAGSVDVILCLGIAAGREDIVYGIGIQDLTIDRVNLTDPVDLIFKQFYSENVTVRVTQGNVNDISPDSEGTSLEIHVITAVLTVNEKLDQFPSVDLLTGLDGKEHVPVLIRVTGSVDAGNGSHDDGIAVFQDSIISSQSQHVQLVIDHGVLLNVGI